MPKEFREEAVEQADSTWKTAWRRQHQESKQ